VKSLIAAIIRSAVLPGNDFDGLNMAALRFLPATKDAGFVIQIAPAMRETHNAFQDNPLSFDFAARGQVCPLRLQVSKGGRRALDPGQA